MYSLEYAEDVVLIAEEEKGMRCMIMKLKEYLRKKELELNVKKSKVVRFIKGERREKKMEWWWKRERMEKVRKIKLSEVCFSKQ